MINPEDAKFTEREERAKRLEEYIDKSIESSFAKGFEECGVDLNYVSCNVNKDVLEELLNCYRDVGWYIDKKDERTFVFSKNPPDLITKIKKSSNFIKIFFPSVIILSILITIIIMILV
jgi:hypothetical protein